MPLSKEAVNSLARLVHPLPKRNMKVIKARPVFYNHRYRPHTALIGADGRLYITGLSNTRQISELQDHEIKALVMLGAFPRAHYVEYSVFRREEADREAVNNMADELDNLLGRIRKAGYSVPISAAITKRMRKVAKK